MSKLFYVLLLFVFGSPISVDSIKEPRQFRFDTLAAENTIEIIGGRNSDEPASFVPRIEVRNGLLKINRCDNVVFDSIVIYGGSLELISSRQCHYRSIQIDKSQAETAMLIRSERDWAGDATNNCQFDFVSIYNCDSSVYLRIQGGGNPGGLGAARDLTFAKMFLSAPWGPEAKKKSRTFLSIKDVCSSDFRFTIATDASVTDGYSIFVANVNDCSFRGSVRGESKRAKVNQLGPTNEWNWIR